MSIGFLNSLLNSAVKCGEVPYGQLRIEASFISDCRRGEFRLFTQSIYLLEHQIFHLTMVQTLPFCNLCG